MYILELKIWRGEEYHKNGIKQLANYLEQYGLDKGYLLIFDFGKTNRVSEKVEEITVLLGEKRKNISEVYV